ncbi:hypothetical protein GCM10010211_05380 [Streptomyces albospinus]|uniref:Uncharacterized protein n=1 Tax=Streptomyces albospinus TaxID=285515 RepID=A0ABQ2UM80_9ACTN|nr:hypothetical protein GCM10010211_05380 [Streptomyces albospinus]
MAWVAYSPDFVGKATKRSKDLFGLAPCTESRARRSFAGSRRAAPRLLRAACPCPSAFGTTRSRELSAHNPGSSP